MEINADMAVELLRRAVAVKGEDYVYVSNSGVVAGSVGEWPLCHYLHDGGVPGCIVGHALVEIGCDKSILREYNGASILELRGAFGEDFTFTRNAVRVLAAAQSRQDSGGTWGEALARARVTLAMLTIEDVDKLIARNKSV